MAAARLARRAATGQTSRLSDLPLLDFVPAINPGWSQPRHLFPLVDAFERSQRGPVRVLVSVPPRHGKTELVLHAAVWSLLKNPFDRVLYASYSQQFANNKSRLARDYALRAGLKLRDDSQAVSEWLTPEFGGFIARGLDGGITGLGFNKVIIDDPFKNRKEAESAIVRETIFAGYSGDVRTRIEPGGSVFVVHTRWHPDDLIGRLEQDRYDDGSPAWEVINLPAIIDEGEPTERALWPERWPLTALNELRGPSGVTDYDWASLYMGRPRPKGGAVFNQPAVFDELPRGSRIRFAIGIDVAYTARTSSDFSVAVVLARIGDRYYVVDVLRMQDKTPVFGRMLKALRMQYGGARIVWYGAGTERGVADQMAETLGVPIDFRAATRDKFTRAQPLASAWNRGAVLVPKNARALDPDVDPKVPVDWLDALLLETGRFTGLNDPHDDQIDALAAAFDALAASNDVIVKSGLAGPRSPIGDW